MPLFIFIGHDGPEGLERRKAHRERHVAHLEHLYNEGRLVFGGPIRDASDRSVGAVLVIEAPDLAAARGIVDQDPYVVAGVFENVTLSRFVRAFPR
ncbi:MAG: YciI family protein [Candidatus Binatia bacterium]